MARTIYKMNCDCSAEPIFIFAKAEAYCTKCKKFLNIKRITEKEYELHYRKMKRKISGGN